MTILDMTESEYFYYCQVVVQAKPLSHSTHYHDQRVWYPIAGDYGILEFTRFPRRPFSTEKVFVQYTVWRGETGVDPVQFRGNIHIDPYTEEPIYGSFKDYVDACLFLREVVRKIKETEKVNV